MKKKIFGKWKQLFGFVSTKKRGLVELGLKKDTKC